MIQGVQGPLETGQGKEMDSPLKPPDGMQPANTVILVLWDPFWTFDL